MVGLTLVAVCMLHCSEVKWVRECITSCVTCWASSCRGFTSLTFCYSINMLRWWKACICGSLLSFHMNNIDKHLEFKLSEEENNTKNYLDLYIHRNTNSIDIRIYRKPTHTDATIQFSSNHPLEHKLATFNFYINRMLTLPITKQAQQQEWKIILAIAQNNGFPLQIIHNLQRKLMAKKQKFPTTTTKKWVTFSYHSPLICEITNLFKHTNLNIALCATNTIHQQVTDKIVKTSTNSSRIYELKCNTCNNSYVGQSDISTATRHKEHTRYIRSNNPISVYALHIQNNRHEYGTAEETLELLKPCNKGTKIICFEALYMQAFHQCNILIE